MQVIYKAQGSNASWEWLETISPCISVFRQLAAQMNETLGEQLGSKHHSPDLERDLVSLIGSMRENGIFHLESGRVLRDMKNTEVPNVVVSGLKQLPNPLSEYNKMFDQLQRRRREAPLVTPPSTPAATVTATAPAHPTNVAPPAVSHHYTQFIQALLTSFSDGSYWSVFRWAQ